MKKIILFVITLILVAGLMLLGTVGVFADTEPTADPGGMDNIMAFIRPELFILIIFLYAAGLFLKLYKGFKQEWTIPYILLGLSFIVTIAYVSIVLKEGFGPPVIVAEFIQAVLIAAVSVFGNQLIKQALVKRKE